MNAGCAEIIEVESMEPCFIKAKQLLPWCDNPPKMKAHLEVVEHLHTVAKFCARLSAPYLVSLRYFAVSACDSHARPIIPGKLLDSGLQVCSHYSLTNSLEKGSVKSD